MRADGSSKFISSNRYGYFPSVSAGWNLGEESWWKYPQTDVKFRASWVAPVIREVSALMLIKH